MSGRAEHSSLAARLVLPPYNLSIHKYDGGATRLVLPFAHECWLPRLVMLAPASAAIHQTLEPWPIFRF